MKFFYCVEYMVEIVVSAFNSSVTPTSITSAFNSADAIAEYQVNLDEWIGMFAIQCPDNLLDATASAPGTSNIKYYVDTAASSTYDYSFFTTADRKKLNPSLARVTLNAAAFVDSSGSAFATGGLAVVNDYIRDLARQELGSPFLTNLFINEKDVQKSLIDGAALEVGDIRTLLTGLNGSSSGTYMKGTGSNKYTDDVYDSPNNICRVLFQGLYAQAPQRFDGIDTINKCPLPFYNNDSIVFTLLCDNSAQRVGENTGWATPASVLNRKYKIRLILKAPTVDASSVVTPSAVNPTADAVAAIFIE